MSSFNAIGTNNKNNSEAQSQKKNKNGIGLWEKCKKTYESVKGSYWTTIIGAFLLTFLILAIWRPALVRTKQQTVNLLAIVIWSTVLAALAFFIQWKFM